MSKSARRVVRIPTFVESLEARQLLAAHPVKPTTVIKAPTKPAVIATPLVNNVSGIAYADNHGDAVYDTPIDTPLVGVRVYLDANNSGTFNTGEASYITQSDGSYIFTNVVAGIPIREVVPAGYVSTTSGTAGITPTGTATGRNIGNFNTTIQALTVSHTTEVSYDSNNTTLTIYTRFDGPQTAYFRINRDLISNLTINGTSESDALHLDMTYGGPAPTLNITFNAAGDTDSILVSAPYTGYSGATFTGNSALSVGNVHLTATNNEGVSVQDRVDAVDSITIFGTSGLYYVSGGDGGGPIDTISLVSADWTVGVDLGQAYGGDFYDHVIVNAVSGTNTIRFNESQHITALNLLGNTAAIMGPGVVLNTKALAINNTSSLDIGTGGVIVNYAESAASPINTIAGLIKSGYNNGNQNAPGIKSAVAGSVPQRRIGYAEARDVVSFADPYGYNFMGDHYVDTTSVVLRYTVNGDADLDGGVSINDFNRLSRRFGVTTGSLWSQGDFDYDGGVSINDFNLLSANFGKSV